MAKKFEISWRNEHGIEIRETVYAADAFAAEHSYRHMHPETDGHPVTCVEIQGENRGKPAV